MSLNNRISIEITPKQQAVIATVFEQLKTVQAPN